MIGRIFILISVFFIVGGLGVWRICVKKPPEKPRLVLKYFTYLLIVYALCAVFAFTSFSFYAVALISAVGFFEIIYAWSHTNRKNKLLLFYAVICYAVISSLFLGGCMRLNGEKLLALYALVLSFDGFSQVCGQLFGKTKITLKISPNKTLGGLLGGLLLSFVGGYCVFGGADYLKEFLLCWLVVVPSAFVGDLLASLYKRKCGIKDYSNLLPGHGGVLDRFDSFIFAVAVLELLSASFPVIFL